MKSCTKCRETKPLSEFGVARKHADGLRYECRTCQREYNRKRYETNTRTCWVANCTRKTRDQSQSLCAMHALRVRKDGTTGPAEPLLRLGDEASYEALHMRIRSRRGRASERDCVDCGRSAQHWSYDYGCSNERQSIKGPYSLDVGRYQPRCAQCHKTFDMNRSELVSA